MDTDKWSKWPLWLLFLLLYNIFDVSSFSTQINKQNINGIGVPRTPKGSFYRFLVLQYDKTAQKTRLSVSITRRKIILKFKGSPSNSIKYDRL